MPGADKATNTSSPYQMPTTVRMVQHFCGLHLLLRTIVQTLYVSNPFHRCEAGANLVLDLCLPENVRQLHRER